MSLIGEKQFRKSSKKIEETEMFLSKEWTEMWLAGRRTTVLMSESLRS